MLPSELKAMMQYEVERHIPFSVSEVRLPRAGRPGHPNGKAGRTWVGAGGSWRARYGWGVLFGATGVATAVTPGVVIDLGYLGSSNR